MYSILIIVGPSMFHKRQFEDNGAGAGSVLSEATEAFINECFDAQISADKIKEPITVELINTEGGYTITSKTLLPLTS